MLVEHPDRGRIVFLCRDLGLNPIEIIRLYGLRFKIEFSFKQVVRTLGAYGCHFWMRTMDKIGSRSGDQYLHRKTDQYRDAIRCKLAAYHRFIQIDRPIFATRGGNSNKCNWSTARKKIGPVNRPCDRPIDVISIASLIFLVTSRLADQRQKTHPRKPCARPTANPVRAPRGSPGVDVFHLVCIHHPGLRSHKNSGLGQQFQASEN